MNITGFLAIGNGEKCPYCILEITEGIDTLSHMINDHPSELDSMLFPKETKE
jgi:hypothetical protein